MITTIIFDFGGVLGTDADTIFVDVLVRHGFTKKEAEKIFDLHWPKIKTGEEDSISIWKAVKERRSVDISKLMSEHNDEIGVDEEMLNFCKKLKEQGFKLGVLANEGSDWMDVKRKKGRLNEIFEVVFSSADLKVPKPQEKAYEKTLSELGASKPDEVLFIDNTERNTKAAEKLGIKTIVFSNIQQLRKDLENLGIKISK